MKIQLILALAAALAVARAEDTTSVAFSDPSKPGTLRIRVWHGDVTIHGADVKEVTVKSATGAAAKPTPRDDGMRVLSEAATFSLSEKDNVAVLNYGSEGWTDGSTDFDITVPRSTSVIVSNSVHGDVTCSDIGGDIDVRTTHGDVKLQNVVGGALVESVKGDVVVSITSANPTKPLSFSSMSGDVVVHAPADLKASVRFRTHRGTILTNFDDKVLVTKTEFARHEHKDKPSADMKAPPPPAPDVAKGPKAPEAREDRDEDNDEEWRSELKDSIRQATRDIAIAAREAAEAARRGVEEARIEIDGSMDKLPPLPPMTGGKTVTGTLNGGGVELQVATLNGDITLKKAN